ncbi:MAG: cyclic nucleotide-binding domain-containing protein [Bdellovibrionales bacterium]|nr:cyclic nucleotide-binding domain-containing protein [Bdellovibrionales bacterium]
MVHPKALALSKQGSRHQVNDDAALINAEQGIYIICDGVSEGGNGKHASDYVSKFIQTKLMEGNQYLEKSGAQLLGAKRLQYMQEWILGAFTQTQENLLELGKSNANYKQAATTCIAVWINGRFAILAHIGDSRAYLARAGKVYQLTRDHSGLDELVKMGMDPSAAMKHPMARALSRALGSSNFANPDLLKIEFQPNDNIFLCTDGIYAGLDSHQGVQQLVNGIVQGQDAKMWVDRCAQVSGDDSTFIHIHFPANMLQESPLLAAERIKLIQETPLCKYLDYVQRSHISAICEIEEFKAGSVIVQEGTQGENMYIVAKGTLEITSKGHHLMYKKPGGFLGEVAVVKSTPRTATALAKEDCILLSLSRTDLFEVFKKDPQLEKHIYHGMLDTVIDRMVEQGKEIAHLKGV